VHYCTNSFSYEDGGNFCSSFSLQLTAKVDAQKITLNVNKTELSKVFESIKKQSGFSFFYDFDAVAKAGTVTVSVKNADINEAVNEVLKGLPFSFTIRDKVIIVSEKKPAVAAEETVASYDAIVKGKITDENKEPLIGASVTLKGSKKLR